MRGPLVAILASLTLAPAASAQMAMPTPRPSCPAVPASLPSALAGWATPSALPAAVAAAAAPTLAIGRGARLALAPTPRVRYAIAPAKAGGPDSFGGLVAFSVPRAGRYSVLLSTGAWIDVVRDGKALASAAHGNALVCAGMRKRVDFDLTPGGYRLQIGAEPTPRVTVMIVPAPRP